MGICEAQEQVKQIEERLNEGYTGEIPMLINIDDEKMRDIMREYYSNISKASKSYSSLGSQQDASKMEDFGEVSGLQNISENQESLTKAMAIQANPKLEDGPSKSKDDTNGVRRFENVPYLD